MIYRVAQEALTNAGRHAGAERVDVELIARRTAAPSCACATTASGFDPAAERDGGLGLEGMAERARLVGGELDLRSVTRRRHRADAEAAVIRVLIADDHGIVRSGLIDADRTPGRHAGRAPRPRTASRRSSGRWPTGPTWPCSTCRCRG